MAYYRIEDYEIVPPPPEVLAADADPAAKALVAKHNEAAKKTVAARNAATKEAVDKWVTLVVDERTGQPVCLCGGSVQAEYVVGLLNDRPPK
jgi:hypothetical protein